MGPKKTTRSTRAAQPTAPVDTPALDEAALPALTLAPRAPITALRWYGRAEPALPLPATQRRFTLGARGCDLIVPRAVATTVSPVHAIVTRVHSGLRIEDRDTRNGTFRTLGSARLASFQIEAGDRFWVADLSVIALDAALEVLRPSLAWCLGLDAHGAIDRATEAVALGRPIALLGPVGTDAARLARAIHDASPQRGNPFLAVSAAPLPSRDVAGGGTVFLELDRLRLVPAPHLRAWFDATRGVRLIVAAADERRLRACVDTYRDQLDAIVLAPLAERPTDLPRLLDRLWRDELGSLRRVDELGRGIGGLASYRWPRNLDELREHAPRLLAYLEHGGLRRAAHALGITHQTLDGHFQRIGFAPTPRWPSGAREVPQGWITWPGYSNRSDVNRCGGASSTANPIPIGLLAQ